LPPFYFWCPPPPALIFFFPFFFFGSRPPNPPFFFPPAKSLMFFNRCPVGTLGENRARPHPCQVFFCLTGRLFPPDFSNIFPGFFFFSRRLFPQFSSRKRDVQLTPLSFMGVCPNLWVPPKKRCSPFFWPGAFRFSPKTPPRLPKTVAR